MAFKIGEILNRRVRGRDFVDTSTPLRQCTRDLSVVRKCMEVTNKYICPKGLFAFLLLFTAQALHAAGFDRDYRVYQGDLAPADGLIDLYVHGKPAVPIMVDDLVVIIPPAVTDFVLKNNGNGTFQVIAPLTSAQRSAARTWSSASVTRGLRDVDANGTTDLTLRNLSTAVSGAFDQTLFASAQRGQAPLHLSPHNANYQNYHRDLARWLLDPGYFDNVPLKLVSQQPPTPVWYGAPPDETDYGTIFRLIAQCKQRFPSRHCGYTSIDPTPNSQDPNGCTRTVDVLDPITLQRVGTTTANVCERDAHVYVYVPGSVTLEPDDSVFNADARESADILEDFQANCTSVPDAPAERLGEILTTVYGGDLWENEGRGPANNINSFPHAPFPNDHLFDPSDLTFHHYDVVTELCTQGTPGCNAAHLESLLRYYSYPAFWLQAVYTQVDYIQRVWAFATVMPLGPIGYVVPIGQVKQQFVTPPFGSGAIQNVTQDNHLVFPGTITRIIRPLGPWMDVMTHGIGINRAFCTLYSPKIPVQVIAGWGNDVFGAEAFRALDEQMKDFFDDNPVGLPSGSSGPGFNKPDIQQVGRPAVYAAPPES